MIKTCKLNELYVSKEIDFSKNGLYGASGEALIHDTTIWEHCMTFWWELILCDLILIRCKKKKEIYMSENLIHLILLRRSAMDYLFCYQILVKLSLMDFFFCIDIETLICRMLFNSWKPFLRNVTISLILQN